MAGKKAGDNSNKAGAERFITSASGITVIKKGGGATKPAKRSSGGKKGGK